MSRINTRILRVPGVSGQIDERPMGSFMAPMEAAGEALADLGDLAANIAVKEKQLDDDLLVNDLTEEAELKTQQYQSDIENAKSPEDIKLLTEAYNSGMAEIGEGASGIGSPEKAGRLNASLSILGGSAVIHGEGRKRKMKVDQLKAQTDDRAETILRDGILSGKLDEAIAEVESLYEDAEGEFLTPAEVIRYTDRAIGDIKFRSEYQKALDGEPSGDLNTDHLSAAQIISIQSERAKKLEAMENEDKAKFESQLPFRIADEASGSWYTGVLDSLDKINADIDKVYSDPETRKIQKDRAWSAANQVYFASLEGELLEGTPAQAVAHIAEVDALIVDAEDNGEGQRALYLQGQRERLVNLKTGLDQGLVDDANIRLDKAFQSTDLAFELAVGGGYKMTSDEVESAMTKSLFGYYSPDGSSHSAGIKSEREFNEVRKMIRAQKQRYQIEKQSYRPQLTLLDNVKNGDSSSGEQLGDQLVRDAVSGEVNHDKFWSGVTKDGSLSEEDQAAFDGLLSMARFEQGGGKMGFMPSAFKEALNGVMGAKPDERNAKLKMLFDGGGVHPSYFGNGNGSAATRTFSGHYAERREADDSHEDALKYAKEEFTSSEAIAQRTAARWDADAKDRIISNFAAAVQSSPTAPKFEGSDEIEDPVKFLREAIGFNLDPDVAGIERKTELDLQFELLRTNILSQARMKAREHFRLNGNLNPSEDQLMDFINEPTDADFYKEVWAAAANELTGRRGFTQHGLVDGMTDFPPEAMWGTKIDPEKPLENENSSLITLYSAAGRAITQHEVFGDPQVRAAILGAMSPEAAKGMEQLIEYGSAMSEQLPRQSNTFGDLWSNKSISMLENEEAERFQKEVLNGLSSERVQITDHVSIETFSVLDREGFGVGLRRAGAILEGPFRSGTGGRLEGTPMNERIQQNFVLTASTPYESEEVEAINKVKRTQAKSGTSRLVEQSEYRAYTLSPKDKDGRIERYPDHPSVPEHLRGQQIRIEVKPLPRDVAMNFLVAGDIIKKNQFNSAEVFSGDVPPYVHGWAGYGGANTDWMKKK